MKRLSVMILSLSLMILSGMHYAFAGPLVIRDSRINDLAITPTLGRGYTLVTNTFQSQCMENVVVTEPSYDFQYRFETVDINKDTLKTVESKTDGTYANPGIKLMAEGAGKISSGTGETSYTVKVELNMNTYYASLNEARTTLSGSAEKLLKNKDYPSFFNACGSNYIRSLGRNAKFISMFTYTTTSGERDAKFEADIQVQVKGFGAALSGGKSTVHNKTTADFSSKATEKKLIITTWAWGLAKNDSASLISYDIDTFKAAIKEAFISMQNPTTGRVTTMEVVPWVENTAFQEAIDLEETQSAVEGEKVPNYKKKQMLNTNAELLAEIERAERNIINTYYKAKICREAIKADYMDDGGTALLPEFAEKKIINNRTGKADYELKKLADLVSEAYLTKILSTQDKFNTSSKQCLDGIFGADLFRKKWSEIAGCGTIRELLVSPTEGAGKVEDYCIPVIDYTVVETQSGAKEKSGAATGK